MEKLRDLGVLYWSLDADNYEKDPRLAAIRKERGYSYQVGLQTLMKNVAKYFVVV